MAISRTTDEENLYKLEEDIIDSTVEAPIDFELLYDDELYVGVTKTCTGSKRGGENICW